MTLFWWWLAHHILAILVGLLTLVFAASVVNQRRPTGSAAAWLLVIVLLPYVGIPLYLLLGRRKMRGRALRKRALPFNRPQLAQALGRPTPPEAIAPNEALATESVRWLVDGVAAYHTLLDAIDHSEHSIRIQTFVVGDDPTGRAILAALTDRAHQGIPVHLLLDDLLAFRAPQESLAKLEAAGGRVSRFMPVLHLPFRGRANLRNHRKIALFDGQSALVGGINLAADYMGPTETPTRFRDLSVFLRGPSVAVLDDVFRADWEFASGETLSALAAAGPSNTPIEVLPSGPDCSTDTIYDAILTAVFRAERRLWVATPYFVPDEGLARALEAAARRGVDVRVLLPARSNHRLADYAAGPCLRELASAGGTVHRYLPGMLHAKALLVDDALAMVGSANFDMRSLFLNYEIAILFSGVVEAAQLAAWFEATFQLTSTGPARAGRLRVEADNLCRLLAPLI